MSKESTSSSIDFGSLVHTVKFTEAVTNLNKNLEKTNEFLDLIENIDSEKLDVKDEVSLDLYASYSLSTLFWLYLRSTGTDPATVQIKGETDRVRTYMARAKKVYQRKSLMSAPRARINVGAAKRFIRSGLWKAKDGAGVDEDGVPNFGEGKKTIFEEESSDN